MKKRLFYDVETSFCQGHFWRPGWNQTINPSQIMRHTQIISVSWAWDDEPVQNLDWGLKKQCDKKLLKKFIKELDKAHEIVAHNGKRFDIKWIRTRAAYHGLDMKPSYNEVDTLKLCKRYLNLPSNKLAEVARYFSLTAKLDPGGIQTWIDVIINKDRAALDRMLEYGDGDIITLREVFKKLQPYVYPQTNFNVLTGGEKWQCPECKSSHVKVNGKPYATAAGTVKNYMACTKCNTTYTINNKTFSDYVKFRSLHPSAKGKDFDVLK